MRRWRQKIRSASPLHILAFSEILAIFGLLASLIYLFSFFGITFIQSITSNEEEEADFASDRKPSLFPSPEIPKLVTEALPESDDEIIQLVVLGKIPSYLLESKLGDCDRAVRIRNEALRKITGRDLEGLPVNGFDYNLILGQCCEMPIGYVQLPVGVAGPLVLDGREYYVPMATTEGCLVASTNRGCKAIAESGGAQSVVLRDGMSRAPAVRFPSARRAAELKVYVENLANFETISLVFNR
jgi:hydroxymethylglutaryl-CoA reductase (NADPH)